MTRMYSSKEIINFLLQADYMSLFFFKKKTTFVKLLVTRINNFYNSFA